MPLKLKSSRLLEIQYLPLACLGEGDGLLFGILGEGKIVEISFLQVGFHGRIVRNFFCCDTGFIPYISELVVFFDVAF
jgi:hypothetical protein